MVDLVQQLREPVSGDTALVMVRWGADEIERLRKQFQELTEWAEYWSKPKKVESDSDMGWRCAAEEVLRMLKRAKVSG